MFFVFCYKSVVIEFFFFFSSRRRHTRSDRDWSSDVCSSDLVPLAEVPFAALEADDARVFPAPRAAFLRAWIGTRGHIGRALVRDGNLAAWGVIRPSRRGHKIGPLVANDRAAAESVLAALIAAAGAGEVFLDVPSVNRNALALAQDYGLA